VQNEAHKVERELGSVDEEFPGVKDKLPHVRGRLLKITVIMKFKVVGAPTYLETPSLMGRNQ